MKRRLYDLAGADPGFRFSPYCWRIKLALAHKNLPFETVPWRFTDKPAIAFADTTKVPVLVDGKSIIADSQAIAEYLEEEYSHEASLFGDPPSRALTGFIKAWVEDALHPAIARIVMPELVAKLAPQDQAYYRESREAMLHTSFEELAAARERNVAALRRVLNPVRTALQARPFVAGSAPSYADHILYGALIWARLASTPRLLDDEPEILAWMAAVLETYGLREDDIHRA
jgi:glutathione S-transferase